MTGPALFTAWELALGVLAGLAVGTVLGMVIRNAPLYFDMPPEDDDADRPS